MRQLICIIILFILYSKFRSQNTSIRLFFHNIFNYNIYRDVQYKGHLGLFDAYNNDLMTIVLYLKM